jgi:hypothetical protein
MAATKTKDYSPPTLVDLVSKASAGDLAILYHHIATKESELAEVRKGLEGEIAALVALRKVIDFKVNGKPVRQKRAMGARKGRPPKDATGGGAPDQDNITLASRVKNLLTAHGPLEEGLIATKLNVPLTSLRQSIGRCAHMFKHNGNRLELAIE